MAEKVHHNLTFGRLSPRGVSFLPISLRWQSHTGLKHFALLATKRFAKKFVQQ